MNKSQITCINAELNGTNTHGEPLWGGSAGPVSPLRNSRFFERISNIDAATVDLHAQHELNNGDGFGRMERFVRIKKAAEIMELKQDDVRDLETLGALRGYKTSSSHMISLWDILQYVNDPADFKEIVENYRKEVVARAIAELCCNLFIKLVEAACGKK